MNLIYLHSFCIFVIIHYGSSVSGSPDFDYSDPSSWGKIYPDCNGKSQSPIDIAHPFHHYDTNQFPPFIYEGKTFDHFTLANEVHTVKISPPADTFFVVPPGEITTYNVLEYHLHFGKPGETTGSEHTVEGKTFRAEGQMVTSTRKNGGTVYAVFVTLFEISDSQNSSELFEMITSHFEKVANINTETEIKGFHFRDLLPSFVYGVYKYTGSFTTPPCTEGVDWFVFRATINLTTEQFKRFDVLLSSANGDKMAGNFRPIQPRGARDIYFSALSALFS